MQENEKAKTTSVHPIVMWMHCCGWQGDATELVEDVWNGIVCGYDCPKCGGDWPFWLDAWDEPNVNHCPRTDDYKSRVVWEAYT